MNVILNKRLRTNMQSKKNSFNGIILYGTSKNTSIECLSFKLLKKKSHTNYYLRAMMHHQWVNTRNLRFVDTHLAALFNLLQNISIG